MSAASHSDPPPAVDVGRTDLPEEGKAFQEHLNSFLTTIVETYNFPRSIRVLIASNDWHLNAYAGDAPDCETDLAAPGRYFRLGIIGDALLGMALVHLEARALIDLKQPIGSFIPELAGTSIGDEVTIGHLLSHTGGFQSPNLLDAEVRRELSWGTLMAFLRDRPLFFRPGRVFSYSLTSIVLLHGIIERATGMNGQSLIRQYVLQPLQRDLRTNDAVRERATEGFSDLWRLSHQESAVALCDLFAIYEAIAHARRGHEGYTALSRDAVDTIHRDVIRLPRSTGGRLTELLPCSYGLGTAMFRPYWFGANRTTGEQTLAVRYHVDSPTAVAVVTNAAAPSLCDYVCGQLVNSLTSSRDSSSGCTEHSDLSADELIGSYRSPSGLGLTVRHRSRGVLCQLTDGPKPINIALGAGPSGTWEVQSELAPQCVGIFRDPDTGTPCIMIGTSAHKKQSS